MQDLYEHEAQVIQRIVEGVRVKHMDGSDLNFEKLSRLHRELEGRLEDAGYDVTVDVTPLLEGVPPVVVINGRKEPLSGFDYEKKAYEVKKRYERNEEDPDIEGMV